MNLFFARLHIWRLHLPWYYCGEFIVWGKWCHAKFSFILFGHSIVWYRKRK